MLFVNLFTEYCQGEGDEGSEPEEDVSDVTICQLGVLLCCWR